MDQIIDRSNRLKMLSAGPALLTPLSGRFFRAVRADRVDAVLAPPGPESAGRYHRQGQPALYITAEAGWAAIALGSYMAEDGLPRVIVPLEVDAAQVFDQQDDAACQALGINSEDGNVRWRLALEKGEEPASWRNADAARASGADGIIDRSRGITGGWHVALFRWNALGGPKVRVVGEPVVADYQAARARWPHPPHWIVPTFEVNNG
jgi:RES domain-containing protein